MYSFASLLHWLHVCTGKWVLCPEVRCSCNQYRTIGGRGPSCPQNVFDHCAQTLKRRKLKLGDFYYQSMDHQRKYFWFSRLSGVTTATSLLLSTWDFLKLSFYMFPNNEILKVFWSKTWLNIWNKHPKIPPNTKFQPNQWFWSYEHLKFRARHWLKYRLWRHNYVIAVTSQAFLLPLCRIHQGWYLRPISWSLEQ